MKYLLVILLACSSYIYADNRLEIIAATTNQEDNGGTYLGIDKETVEPGEYPTVWVNIVSKKCENSDECSCFIEKHEMARTVLDCKEKSFVIERIVRFKGDVLVSDRTATQDEIVISKPVPFSNEEKILNYVCKNYYVPSKKK